MLWSKKFDTVRNIRNESYSYSCHLYAGVYYGDEWIGGLFENLNLFI